MRGCHRLANGQPVSAIFLTEHLTEAELPLKCFRCGDVGWGVLRYEAKIGGSDELVTVTACSDIDACLEREGVKK